MKIEITEQDQKNLIAIINNTTVKVGNIESILALKQKILTPVKESDEK